MGAQAGTSNYYYYRFNNVNKLVVFRLVVGEYDMGDGCY